jgi:alpha-galactosidase
MLHRFGFSQGLPDLPDWVRQRYAKHIHDYKHIVRRFVQQGTLVRLTNQPRRNGTLDRFAGFQYVMPGAREMLVALFRLPGAKAQRRFYLDAINPDATYEVTWLDTAQTTRIDGAILRDGWLFAGAPEPGSSLFVLTQVS